MKFCCYLFVLISILSSAYCAAFITVEDPTPKLESESHRSPPRNYRSTVNVHCQQNGVFLPTYAIWLISVAMVAMLIAIICLAVALYLVYRNKKIFSINVNQNKQYVRQESTALTQYHNCNIENENENKNNGSTLTVNSGIIEINAMSEPVTPTREDTKIILTKKPFRPMGPIIQRGQMDEICKAVLKRVQKSDSASFRDLNELLKGKNDEKFETKSEVINEQEKYKKNEEQTDPKQELMQDTKQDVNYETEHETTNEKKDTKNVELKDTKDQSNDKTKEQSNDNMKKYAKEETVTKTSNEEKLKENKAIKIKVQHVERDDIYFNDSDSEAEYDTVPSPVRYRNSGDTPNDLDEDSIPVYDCPPRRSYEGLNRNMIQLDNDSQYLLPLTAKKCDYVNAKRQSLGP